MYLGDQIQIVAKLASGRNVVVREQRASPHAIAGPRIAAEPRGAAVTATGRAGQGSQWISGDAGRHVLVVLSSCRWTIRVVTAIREAAHR